MAQGNEYIRPQWHGAERTRKPVLGRRNRGTRFALSRGNWRALQSRSCETHVSWALRHLVCRFTTVRIRGVARAPISISPIVALLLPAVGWIAPGFRCPDSKRR